MDLDTLMKYSRGDLAPRQFLAVHRDASELLDLLNEQLMSGEYLVTVADWPAVRRRRQSREYLVLKTMMLTTPLIVVGGLVFALKWPAAGLWSGLGWLAAFAVIALALLWRRLKHGRTREGRSVVVVTDRRLMRIWLDGTGEVQSFALSGEKKSRPDVEAVPETVRVLLRADLGKTSMN